MQEQQKKIKRFAPTVKEYYSSPNLRNLFAQVGSRPLYFCAVDRTLKKNACGVVVLAADKEYAHQSMLTKFLVILWPLLLPLMLELRALFAK